MNIQTSQLATRRFRGGMKQKSHPLDSTLRRHFDKCRYPGIELEREPHRDAICCGFFPQPTMASLLRILEIA
jgi:hypothetical protein